MRLALAAGLAVALYLIVHSLALVMGLGGDWDSAAVRTTFGLLQMVAGGAIMAGLLASARRPVLGITLVAVGAMAFSAMWYWFLVITIPVGLVLTGIAFFRARQAGWRWPRGARAT